MTRWLLVLAACGHSHREMHVRDQQPCDPSTETTELPVPAAQQLASTCGDGKVGDYTPSCARRCGIGCGGAPDCTSECRTARELCDGTDFDGRSCEAIGYGAGSLACDAGCMGFSLHGCSLCVGNDCSELVFPAGFQPLAGLELSAVGNDVRAFWVIEGGHLVTALVARDRRLVGTPLDLGERPPMMGPIAATSKGWITVAGDGDRWAVTFVDRTGKVARAALGEPQADFKIAKVSGADEVIVISGDLGSNAAQVVRVDASGKLLPLPATALHATSGFDRLVVAPLPEGKATLGVGSKSIEVTAVKGDHLIAWFHADDPTCASSGCYGGIARLHDGIRVEAQTEVSTQPALAVTSPASIAFDTARDAAGKQSFPVAAWPTAPTDVAPFAPRVAYQPIARAIATSFELRAGSIAEDNEPVRIVLATRPR